MDLIKASWWPYGMDTRTRISWNLRRLRTEQLMTQESLAVDAAVDRTVISEIERGKHNASIDLLDRIAAALRVDIEDLVRNLPSDAKEPAPLKVGRKPRNG
jgi:transcriptional regulator with XRE-family HTH domain